MILQATEGKTTGGKISLKTMDVTLMANMGVMRLLHSPAEGP